MKTIPVITRAQFEEALSVIESLIMQSMQDCVECNAGIVLCNMHARLLDKKSSIENKLTDVRFDGE